MPGDPASNYDKNALVDDLKLAGFEESIANIVADCVDQRKVSGWTYDMAREQAIAEIQSLLKSSHMALDAFRAGTLPSTGSRREIPLAEKIADSSLA